MTRIIVPLIYLAILLSTRAHAQAPETVKYIHTDALGSIVAITDANGQVIERREYEPYGAQLQPDLQDGTGYTGHVQDASTGMVYMQQRYYDPQIGRFLSIDPVVANPEGGDNFNRYWYANNSPYNFTDHDGRLASSIGFRRVRDIFVNDPLRRYALSGGEATPVARNSDAEKSPTELEERAKISFFRLTTFEATRTDTSAAQAVQAGVLTRTVTMPAVMVSASPNAAALAGISAPALAPMASRVPGIVRSRPFREGMYYACIGIGVCSGTRPSMHRINQDKNILQARDGGIRELRRTDIEIPEK